MSRYWWLVLLSISLFTTTARAESLTRDVLAYVGRQGAVKLHGTSVLSDGSVLVAGGATSMNWLPTDIKPTLLGNAAIESGVSGQTAFILHLSESFDRILHVVTLAPDQAVDLRRLQTSNRPDQKTAVMFVSGKRAEDKSRNIKPGYFLGRLDGNFVDKVPSKFEWLINVRAEGDMQDAQPWDVGSDEKVVYAQGTPHGYDWLSINRLTPQGQPDVVEDWRLHWYLGPDGKRSEWMGTPASKCPQSQVIESGIVLKVWGRGDFRSWTEADYLSKSSDGNGGTKQGKWPYDAFFEGPFNPAEPNKSPRGRGYTGYGWPATPCGNVGAIVIDRRDNHLYIGGNNKSTLPKGPDFEPFVIGMTNSGLAKWWMRLYREVPPEAGQSKLDGQDARLSTPDQYVDGLAIDYSKPATEGALVVLARCHGNNVINFWNGHQLKHPKNPGKSFQPHFTGSNGNIHYGWIGRLGLADGETQHATFVGEYSSNSKMGKDSWKDANLDGWPRFDSGWPDINTTRCRSLSVDPQGNVYIVGTGRRPITTKNAMQKMPKPNEGESRWCDFVRVYSPDLTTLKYSSIVAGTWDWKSGQGGSSVTLEAVTPSRFGLLVVGFDQVDAKKGDADATNIPVTNPPAWASRQRSAQGGVVGRLAFDR